MSDKELNKIFKTEEKLEELEEIEIELFKVI
jgi:hypothetical protein